MSQDQIYKEGLHVKTVQLRRYISWPGQATAYRMGERAIRQLRQKLETDQGDEFDIKEFHAGILKCLGPIDELESCMDLQK